MFKSNLLKSYPLTFLLMFCGLAAASTLSFLFSWYFYVNFFWLTTALLLCVCIMPLISFYRFKYSVLLNFLIRLLLSLILGFGLFRHAPLIAVIVITLYALILLSVLSFILSGKYDFVSALCFVIFIFNFVIGFINQRTETFENHSQFLNILITVSLFAALTFFMIQNVEGSRWFGIDRLGIPKAMKRSTIMLLCIIGMLITLVSLSPLIVRAFDLLITFVALLITRFAAFITRFLESLAPQGGVTLPPNGFLPAEPYEPPTEPGIFSIVLTWVIIIVFAAMLVFLFIIALVKLIRFLISFFKSTKKEMPAGDEVFTEVIERLAPVRKKGVVRDYIKRQRYSALQSNRERIIFIYREYVTRAKRKGFTRGKDTATPNEILDEITRNTDDVTFPLPENLVTAVNIAQYGMACYSDDCDELAGADELRRRLRSLHTD